MVGGPPACPGVTTVTAPGDKAVHIVGAVASAVRSKKQMARIRQMVRLASASCQAMSVFALCFGASLILPVALLSVGFHTL